MKRGLLAHGIRATIRHNAAAYAYSVAISGSFALVQSVQGPPEAQHVTLYAIAAGLGFAGVEAVASQGFRHRMLPERSRVVVLGSAISPLSIASSLAAAFAAARLLSGWVAWAMAGFAATVVYLFVAGIEMGLAHRAEERRAADEGEDPEGDEEGVE